MLFGLSGNILLGQNFNIDTTEKMYQITIKENEITGKNSFCDFPHKQTVFAINKHQVDSMQKTLVELNKSLLSKDYFYSIRADLVTGKTELLKEYKFFNSDNSSGNTIYGDDISRMLSK